MDVLLGTVAMGLDPMAMGRVPKFSVGQFHDYKQSVYATDRAIAWLCWMAISMGVVTDDRTRAAYSP